MQNVKFPVIIKDGKSIITFTDSDNGTFESGAVCVSSLADMMIRVESGAADILLSITHVGREIASGKHFAYFEGGQFIVDHADFMAISFKLNNSTPYYVTRSWFDAFTGEKYEY